MKFRWTRTKPLADGQYIRSYWWYRIGTAGFYDYVYRNMSFVKIWSSFFENLKNAVFGKASGIHLILIFCAEPKSVSTNDYLDVLVIILNTFIMGRGEMHKIRPIGHGGAEGRLTTD